MIAPARREGTGRRLRRDYRAWVRAHHPDLGGDPEVFAAGLARRRAQARPRESSPGGQAQVSVFRSRGGLWQVVRWWHRHGHRHRPERRVL